MLSVRVTVHGVEFVTVIQDDGKLREPMLHPVPDGSELWLYYASSSAVVVLSCHEAGFKAYNAEPFLTDRCA